MENRKKIAFVTDKVYPYFIGGQEKRVYESVKLLVESGAEVEIVSMKWWPGESEIVRDGIVYKAICPKLEFYKKNGRRHAWNSFRFGISVFSYAVGTRTDVIDIINFPYFPAIFAWLAKIVARKKFKIIICWLEYCGKSYWKKYLKGLWPFGYVLEKTCLRVADENIAISEFTKKRILAENELADDVMVIPPFTVDIERINSIKASGKKYDIIYFGRLIAHKHVEKVIDLTAKLKKDIPQIKALIIGNGPDEKKLKNLAREKGLLENCVIFMDFLESYDDLIKHIKLSKVMVFPSEREGFGISVLEANACGLPVLMLDYPDNAAKELIYDRENGFVCKNEGDLFIKTLSLIKSPIDGRLDEMTYKSIKLAKYYSKNIVVDKV